MPVQFLSTHQRANYGQYNGDPTDDDLARYFYLDDADLTVIRGKRGRHNQLGFALQLTTARFLGTFLEDPTDVPVAVLHTLIRQLKISNVDRLSRYAAAEQRWEHAAEIRVRYGFCEWSNPTVGFRLSRWLYALCWTGTERPSVIFDRAATWLLAHKVLLPGCTTLERFVARLRDRVEEQLWKRLGRGITNEQRSRLEDLLTGLPEGRSSQLDMLRSGPVRVSGPALVKAIRRLQSVRDFGVKPPASGVPSNRLMSLALCWQSKGDCHHPPGAAATLGHSGGLRPLSGGNRPGRCNRSARHAAPRDLHQCRQ